MQTFHVRVNSGPERSVEVGTGVYMLAAAAALAILDEQTPAYVEIWAPRLLPDYGPYHYLISEDEYGGLRVRPVARTKT